MQGIRPLSEENLDEVFELYIRNEQFFKISKEDFKRQIMSDSAFDPNLSLVYYSTDNHKPIAFIIGVIRNGMLPIKQLTIKALFVAPSHRRKELGTNLFKELIRRAKPSLNSFSFVTYGFSPPQFMQPGVDVRHTSLIFFLESMGLKRKGPRTNLTVEIPEDLSEPKEEKNGYTLQRITPEYFESTLKFIKKEFLAPSWPSEVKLTFDFDVPTTFIALDPQKNIVGFASHSTCFTGSFGPTGVAKSIRKNRGNVGGIGGELLKWCIWDMKQSGLDSCTIMYVVHSTIKYYSKVIGAYINPVHYPMRRNILHWWNLEK